ncbi:ribulokinase [Apibacter sp. HY039]|uniref:ribulokinase n=1 Tax=Apibacter sp. HY039 TaxID=2501476 RepID=UPI000FEBED29|nr:ribulokinase [Apibacter sp. HY039]
MKLSDHLILGIDYGTESMRAILVDIETKKEIAESSMIYPRWKKKLYCNPAQSQFRQHPLDYLEVLEFVVNDIVKKVPEARTKIKALGIDATNCTPIAVDKEGTPLSMKPGFEEDPDAMFILWKDHTAIKDCDDINRHAKTSKLDYTKYSGGGANYSAEHFWAKCLHIFRNPKIKKEAHSFVENCDWLPNLLVGIKKPEELKRNISIAGFKALWNKEWGGYPPNEYFKSIDPVLDGIVDTFSKEVYLCVSPIGTLSEEWASRLNLNTDVIVAAGHMDATAGAIGAGVREKVMVEIVGTSTCAVLAGKKHNRSIPGITGQADDAVIPGLVGYEAGQAAFGDLYAWFRRVLLWPFVEIFNKLPYIDDDLKEKIYKDVYDELIPNLARQAKLSDNDESCLIATDWINGRRTPDVDYNLKGTLAGITLSSTAPLIYKSLVEATIFGTKAIADQFIKHGIEVEEIIAVGGISQKSPFVMQIMSDVLQMPIKVLNVIQGPALGEVMCAAVAAGYYPDLETAQDQLGVKDYKIYTPRNENREFYLKAYDKYRKLENVKQIIE